MKRPLPFDDDVPALKQVTVLEATWTDIPTEVRDEIRQMWRDFEYGNDNYYLSWDWEFAENYPLTAKYLEEHGVEKCLIHFWW